MANFAALVERNGTRKPAREREALLQWRERDWCAINPSTPTSVRPMGYITRMTLHFPTSLPSADGMMNVNIKFRIFFFFERHI